MKSLLQDATILILMLLLLALFAVVGIVGGIAGVWLITLLLGNPNPGLFYVAFFVGFASGVYIFYKLLDYTTPDARPKRKTPHVQNWRSYARNRRLYG